MRTMRDFKNLVLSSSGCKWCGDFSGKSWDHGLFWKKLNKIGRNKRTLDPEQTNDVDASAPLTDEEWSALETELQQFV